VQPWPRGACHRLQRVGRPCWRREASSQRQRATPAGSQHHGGRRRGTACDAGAPGLPVALTLTLLHAQRMSARRARRVPAPPPGRPARQVQRGRGAERQGRGRARQAARDAAARALPRRRVAAAAARGARCTPAGLASARAPWVLLWVGSPAVLFTHASVLCVPVCFPWSGVRELCSGGERHRRVGARRLTRPRLRPGQAAARAGVQVLGGLRAARAPRHPRHDLPRVPGARAAPLALRRRSVRARVRAAQQLDRRGAALVRRVPRRAGVPGPGARPPASAPGMAALALREPLRAAL